MNQRSRTFQLHRPFQVSGQRAIEPNPFRTAAVRPGAVPFFGGDLQQGSSLLVERLAGSFLQHRSGQILGDHGTGKSTLVSSLVEHLRPSFHRTQRLCFVQPKFTQAWDAFRHRRSVSQRLRQTLANCSANTMLIVDGAEQLSLLAYHQLVGSTGRKEIAVLATSHQKLRRMPVLFRTQTSSTLICELTRLQVRGCSHTVRNIVEADLAIRDLNTISNLRDYWFELYDLVQPHLQPSDSYREQQCG